MQSHAFWAMQCTNDIPEAYAELPGEVKTSSY